MFCPLEITILSFLSFDFQAKALEKVESELNAFVEVVKKNQGVANFLANPTIPRAEKTAKVSYLTRSFHSFFNEFAYPL